MGAVDLGPCSYEDVRLRVGRIARGGSEAGPLALLLITQLGGRIEVLGPKLDLGHVV